MVALFLSLVQAALGSIVTVVMSELELRLAPGAGAPRIARRSAWSPHRRFSFAPRFSRRSRPLTISEAPERHPLREGV